jgi:1,2-diacylglycerol 3-beta-galactosyltransferase
MKTSLDSPPKKLSIDFVTGSGGGGHIATYKAIRSIIEQQHLPWHVSETNIDEMVGLMAEQKQTFDIYRLFGTSPDQFINQIAQSGWNWIHWFMTPLNKLLIALHYEAGLKMLESHWWQKQPDLVISVVPLFNKILWDSLQRVKPGTPVVTVLTDFADMPSAFWIEPKTGNYTVCGTERAAEQARSLGVQEQRIVKTSGIVLHPRFYEPITCDRAQERQRLGLDPDRFTGLVLFGGCGSDVMLEIAQRLECFHPKLQLIFLCGHNAEVASALRSRPSLQKQFVSDFTQDIPYYMHLADFFIGKPGPGSLSEAVVMNLPVIVERNWGTIPQERYNAEWVRQKQVGLVIPSFRHIQKAVGQFLEPENFAHYRANVSAINNRAVFEIPEILQQILDSHDQTTVARSLVQNSYCAEQPVVPG